MNTSIRFLISLCLAISIAGVNCVSPVSPTEEIPAITGINVTGKILLKDNTPVKGAMVSLLKSHLSAVTDSTGTYYIKGEVNTLAKVLRSVSDTDTVINDTILVVVPNPGSSDSSEITRESIQITSGVIMELPPKYIVQREIRGYLSPDDEDVVKNITAVVYDTTVPDLKKYIPLWHDVVNGVFNSFAYFSSETNKTYCLYVMVYDTAGKFIGRSPDFIFPDQAGDIEFTKPFAFNNAKPTINISQNYHNLYIGDTLKFYVSSIDSFDGTIINSDIKVNDSVIKSISNESNLYLDTISIIIPDTESFTFTLTVTDNDGNIVEVSRELTNIKELPMFPRTPDMPIIEPAESIQPDIILNGDTVFTKGQNRYAFLMLDSVYDTNSIIICKYKFDLDSDSSGIWRVWESVPRDPLPFVSRLELVLDISTYRGNVIADSCVTIYNMVTFTKPVGYERENDTMKIVYSEEMDTLVTKLVVPVVK